MNHSVATTTARAVAIALIIAVAAVAGLAVGNAIQGHRLGTITAEAGSPSRVGAVAKKQAFTDTFRLTGPSRVGAVAKTQAFTDTFRLTGPSQLDDEDDWDGMIYGPPGR